MAWTILEEDHQRNISAKLYWNRSSCFWQEDFLVKKSIFSSCYLDMQWTGTIWTTLKEDQPRIIPVKFGQNPISGLGGDVQKLWTDGRRRWTVSDHKSLPWAFGSVELISPAPGGIIFWRIQIAWTILVEDHQSNISAKLYWNRSSGFWQEGFLSF